MSEDQKKPADPPTLAARRWTPDYIALWAIALISLLLNALLFRQMILARAAAQQGINDTLEAIDQFEQTTITTDVAIHDTVVVEADLPIKETVPVEIDDNLPIDTTVQVPVDAGLLGKINLTVPIKTTIPVHLTTDVTIDRSFHIKAPVPLNLSVPVTISIKETGLAATLDGVRARLRALAARLDAPLLPFPGPATPEAK